MQVIFIFFRELYIDNIRSQFDQLVSDLTMVKVEIREYNWTNTSQGKKI